MTLAPSEAAKAKARAKPPKTPSKPPCTNKESTSPTNAEPASDFVGARWQKLAPSKPTVGQEMEHAGLAAALASGQLTFTEDELGALGGLLNEVRRDDFIRADDNYYYKPADRSMHGVPSRLGAIVSAKTLAARAAKEERKRMAEERRAAEASAWMAEWSKWLGGLDLPKLILDAAGEPSHLINGASPVWDQWGPPCSVCDKRPGSAHSCVVCKTSVGVDWTYTLVRKLLIFPTVPRIDCHMKCMSKRALIAVMTTAS